MARVLRAVLIVATMTLAGCPSSAKPQSPRSPEDVALRLRVANDEAKRAGGIGELVLMARGADANEKVLALRGLARIGGGEAREAMHEALKSTDPATVIGALDAIQLSGALDEAEPGIGL